MRTFTFAILLFVYSTTFSQSNDRIQVEQTVERYRLAMEKPDSAVLADLASDDLEYVHSSGTVRDKRGFINEFIKKQTVVTNVKFSNQSIKLTGDVAIVRHRMESDFHVKGYPPKLDILILMVWRKENGEWEMLARQAAKLPEQR